MLASVQSSSDSIVRSTPTDLTLRLVKFAARSAPESTPSAEANTANASALSHEPKVRTIILIVVLCTMFLVVWSVLICRARRRRANSAKDLEKQYPYEYGTESAARRHQNFGAVARPESQVPIMHSSSSTSDFAASQYRESPPMFNPSPLYSQKQLSSSVILNHSSAELNPPPPAYTKP
ncbi:hypothetical protein FRC04_002204 [Tulasnella sp. 424]|nr:hypothetical protein FRC04_002204 [Tulasnella sp. 424]